MHDRGSPAPEPSLNQLFQQLGRRSKEFFLRLQADFTKSDTTPSITQLFLQLLICHQSVYETLGSKAVWAFHSKGPGAVDPVGF